MENIENVIILGSGCAGLTAAIYTARAGLAPLVIEGGQPGGQLTTTSEIENFPGFPDGIDGFSLTENMRKQAARFGARFAGDTIASVALAPADAPDEKRLSGSGGKTYVARALIVATGAAPRKLGLPDEEKFYGGNGLTFCATCDGAFYRRMEVAVVGGGDSACEEALFLTRFATRVHLVHRRDKLRASDIMAARVLAHEKISPVWDSVPAEILADADGLVRGLVCRNVKTGALAELACKGIFAAIGHEPNTQALRGALKTDPAGYIVASDASGVRTEIPGVFVAGDCSDHVYRQAITAAGMGCRAAIEAERWLAETFA
ncbi:MAG: thioredoxin-disulfide reductase [Puniceicoccales bacterium]|jgi:thioredoxin reductase (NADPH)|nr:thioredoxin-disulfide reductase [Puniceicoccales bacterium]